MPFLPGTDARPHWPLDPGVLYLNHGAFGACPRAVLEAQSALREELEREPVAFFMDRLEGLLDAARAALGRFVGADPDDLAFVTNASTGVNTVLASAALEPQDELLITNHGYQACRNAAQRWAAQRGATVVEAAVPFPLSSEEQVLESVLARVTPRTRLALLDHVTSPTGLVFPIARLVQALADRGVDTLVDGAHGPGMLELDLRSLGAAFYTGNCHKWMCAPKGAAFLHVRRDLQANLRPLVTSHGANSPRTDRSRFRLEFDFMGTSDPTPFLGIPGVLTYLEEHVAGGWRAIPRPQPRPGAGWAKAAGPCPGDRAARAGEHGGLVGLRPAADDAGTGGPGRAPAPGAVRTGEDRGPGLRLRAAPDPARRARGLQRPGGAGAAGGGPARARRAATFGLGWRPFRMPRYATIDIGTNSVLLLVAEPDGRGGFAPVREFAEITRLGRGVDRSGQLSAQGMEETVAAVERFAREARALGARSVLATATSAARDAANGAEFLSLLERRAGLRAEIISGDDEARLSFLAVLPGWASSLTGQTQLVVIDIGGGSTELIYGTPGTGGSLAYRRSFNVGSVRMSERFSALGATAQERIRSHLEETFREAPLPQRPTRVVGVAGTVTTLFAIRHRLEPYDAAQVEGRELSLEEIRQVRAQLWSLPLEERQHLPGLQPKRADVIPAGALILETALERLGVDRCGVSDRGVRWGLLLDRFGNHAG